MTARDIADRFLGTEQDYFGGEVTLTRQRKLLKLCERSKVSLVDVLALLPAEVVAQMKGE